MDAKPHRPSRVVRVRANENEIPLFSSHCGKENIHRESTTSSNPKSSIIQQQRNRSATALATLPINVATIGHVLRRTAFADVSNTATAPSLKRAKDDLSILKSSASSLSTLAENQETQNQGSKSRPLAAANGDRGKTDSDKVQSTYPVSKQVVKNVSTTTVTTQFKPPIPDKSAARLNSVYSDSATLIDEDVHDQKQQCEERPQDKVTEKTHKIDAVRIESTNHNTDAGSYASKIETYSKSKSDNNGHSTATEVPQQQPLDTTTNQTQKIVFNDVNIDDISNIKIKSTSPTGSESPGTTVPDFVDHIDVDNRSEAGDYDDDDDEIEDEHPSSYVDALQDVEDDAVPTPADVSMQSPDGAASTDITAPTKVNENATTTAIASEAGMDSDDEEDYQDDECTETAQPLRGQENTTMVLYPEITRASKKEIAIAKQIVETSRTAEIDDECWDVTMVTEYSDDILNYMREMEVKLLPNPHYMDNQTEIQWSMRSVLMDWIVQVHLRFNLIPETLFLTVNYIDRFLSSKVVSLGKLQLVGATAIFIAAKYEEVTCPSLAEIIYMVDNTYTAEEILKAERFMLAMLQFELGWPGPMSFLRRISKADEYDYDTRTLAKYLLEVTIMDERFVGAPASFLAAGAHCLARLMLRKGTWTPTHVYYSNYTYTQLHPVLLLLLDCVDQAQTHHPSIQEKYSHSRYKRASIFVEREMASGFKIPDISCEEASASSSSIKEMFWGEQWAGKTANGMVTAK